MVDKANETPRGWLCRGDKLKHIGMSHVIERSLSGRGWLLDGLQFDTPEAAARHAAQLHFGQRAVQS